MTRKTYAVACCVFVATISAGIAQDDEDRDRQVVGRFLTVLERAPRKGTALDRVYGYHVEHGTLDALLKTYRDRVALKPDDGAAWMIIGLMEAHRGQDAAAVAALRQAERLRPDDPMTPYYLGQTLVLIGEPTAAAEAFERALARNPPRADLLEIYQALARVHQRSRRNDLALAAWAAPGKGVPRRAPRAGADRGGARRGIAA